MKTTLNKIREHQPSKDGWDKLLTYLGKTQANDEPISIATIIDSNGLSDALWCLRAVDGYDKEIRLYAVWCARQVQHLTTDQRSRQALAIAERYANGEATEEELKDASSAASEAASATNAAAYAAYYAANAADWAAMVAAGAAEAAVWVAEAAASAAWGVSGAADWDRMRAKQEVELRRICDEGLL